MIHNKDNDCGDSEIPLSRDEIKESCLKWLSRKIRINRTFHSQLDRGWITLSILYKNKLSS